VTHMSDRLVHATSTASVTNDFGVGSTPALFAYGTLMLDPVIEILIDRVPNWSPRTVHGWRAAPLPGRPYPGLVSADGSVVHGREYHDLQVCEWAILDRFEDSDYELVSLVDGAEISVCAYVWPGAVEAADWSLTTFIEQEMDAYLARCAEWRANNT
jgi:gamma-glutamylcyclotransferase (GGCT)/AIG2-like uncharacterized protein YtfP